MPGTCGTLWGVAIAWAVSTLPMPLLWAPLLGVVILLLGVPLARAVERTEPDPGWFILDEVSGYLIALAGLPLRWEVLAAAFVFFRIFDITKPPPIRRIERAPRGWGVMLDDVVAGVFANLCTWGFYATSL